LRPKKVILCVDDEDVQLSLLLFVLKTHSYRVLATTDCAEAIRLFTEQQVDLVLADFAMPAMSGDQLVEKLKQIGPHIPMILLGDPVLLDGEPHCADAFLDKKKCSAQELLERIRIMSQRKRGPRKGIVPAYRAGLQPAVVA
jgi:two-component system response regulator CpxR